MLVTSDCGRRETSVWTNSDGNSDDGRWRLHVQLQMRFLLIWYFFGTLLILWYNSLIVSLVASRYTQIQKIFNSIPFKTRSRHLPIIVCKLRIVTRNYVQYFLFNIFFKITQVPTCFCPQNYAMKWWGGREDFEAGNGTKDELRWKVGEREREKGTDLSQIGIHPKIHFLHFLSLHTWMNIITLFLPLTFLFSVPIIILFHVFFSERGRERKVRIGRKGAKTLFPWTANGNKIRK